MLNNDYIIKYRKGLTLTEMVISLAIIIVVIAAMLPQLSAIQNGWESRQCGSEALQNGRVLVDHINRNLTKAVRITDVSESTENSGYLEFVGNDGNGYRYEVSAGNIVQFGLVGSLSDLAGPVTQFQITCFDDNDLDTPLDIPVDGVEGIRFVKAEITFVNSSDLGQDKTLLASAYLRTSSSSSSTTGLIAHWPLDELSGTTANDISGNNHHGTLKKMDGDEWSDGIIAGALEFDGSSDYIKVVGLLDEPVDITICAWVNLNTVQTNAAEVVSLGNYVALRVENVSQPENIRIEGSYYTGTVQRNTFAKRSLRKTGWHHVAYVVDDTNNIQKLFVDGVKVTSSSYSGSISYSGLGDNTIIGDHGEHSNGYNFGGDIDDIRIYDRALTDEEIEGFIGSFSVAAGTPFRFESGRNAETPVLSRIDDTHYLCAYDTTVDGWATVLVVDTDTLTVTRETDYAVTATGGLHPTLNQIDSTHYLYVNTDQDPDNDGWARVLQVNTSTWEITAAANYEYDPAYAIDQFVEQIDSTHYLCVYNGLGNNTIAVVLTVDTSGWTVTSGTPFTINANSWGRALEKIDDTHYMFGYIAGTGSEIGYTVVLEVDTSGWTVSTAGPPCNFDTSWEMTLEPLNDSHIMSLIRAIDHDGVSRVFEIDTSTWSIAKYDKYEVNRKSQAFDFDKIFVNNYLYVTGNPITSKGDAIIIEVDPSTYLTGEKGIITEFGSGVDNPDVAQIDVNNYLCVYNDSGGDGWAVILNIDVASADPDGSDIVP